MSKSWFYLTLWHGTPSEFTDELSTEINDTDKADALIVREGNAESVIETVASFASQIRSRESIGTGIIRETEIIWYVG